MKTFITHSITQDYLIDLIKKELFVGNKKVRKKDIREIVRFLLKFLANKVTQKELEFILHWYYDFDPNSIIKRLTSL
jgi:hypothetical protein